MSQRQRVGIILATLVIAVAAFLILRPSDDEPTTSASTNATTPSAQRDPARADPAAERSAKPRPKPKPAAVEIVARGLQPVGGVKEIKLRKGDTIRIVVRSDQADNAHLHGYDVAKRVGPGTTARFAVPANIEGIFELELEDAGVPIAEITVEP